MGSSWIVVPFFFAPVPAPRSFTPLGSACCGLSWERILAGYLDDNTQWTTAEKLKQFEVSPCCLLPIASSVSHKLAWWDRYALRTPDGRTSRLLFWSSSTRYPASIFRNHLCTHINAHHTSGSHLQVRSSTAKVMFARSSPSAERKDRRKKVSFYDVDFFSPGSLQTFLPKGRERTKFWELMLLSKTPDERDWLLKIYYDRREYLFHVFPARHLKRVGNHRRFFLRSSVKNKRIKHVEPAGFTHWPKYIYYILQYTPRGFAASCRCQVRWSLAGRAREPRPHHRGSLSRRGTGLPGRQTSDWPTYYWLLIGYLFKWMQITMAGFQCSAS